MREKIERAKEDLSLAREDLAAVSARADLMRSREEALRAMVAEAKGRLDLQPRAVEFLEKLQRITHERAVGVYEDLLTALVNDILPGKRDVKLELGTERGLPALGIEIEKNGKRESILEGSGGALTNLISAGLRIIALARSGHFPFLVLDEADCWLKPSRVPQFAAVLSQISSDIGVQMLVISHHDPHYFEGLSSMVSLARRGGKIEATPLGDLLSAESAEAASEKAKTISWVILRDFMSHESTRIPLGARMTCLTGENDLGKSAVAAALRAIFYGDCSDAFVRHGQARCEVEVGFGDGHRLLFEHHLKKSPKRRWRFFAPGVEEALMDASPKHGVPEWLEDVAKIQKMEGLDSQLTNQKAPVFLLDQPASKRAAILAIGKEASHLQKMIAKNKQKAADDAMISREGEKELFAIGQRLSAIGDLQSIAAEIGRAREGIAEEEKRAAHLEELSLKLQKLKSAKAAVAAESEMGQAAKIGVAPAIQETARWSRAERSLRMSAERAKATLPDAIGAPPALGGTDRPRAALRRFSRLAAISGVDIPMGAGAAPGLAPCGDGLRKANRCRSLRKALEIAIPPSVREKIELPGTEPWKRMAKSIRAANLAAGMSLPNSIGHPDALRKTEAARATLDLLAALRGRLEKIGAWEEKQKAKKADLEEKARRLAEESGGHCPTCKGEWSVERVLGHSHE